MVTLLFAKQYSLSGRWEPESGSRFLLKMPHALVVIPWTKRDNSGYAPLRQR